MRGVIVTPFKKKDCKRKAEKYDFWGLTSKVGGFGGKVRLVGHFEILAQDNFFEQSPFIRTIFLEILSYWTDLSVDFSIIENL